MQPASRLDHAAHLAGLQGERGVLELLLHVALAEVAEVAALAGGAAVALGGGELAEGRPARPDLLLVVADRGERLVLGARDGGLAPAGRPPALAVLDEQVRRADLALGPRRRRRRRRRRREPPAAPAARVVLRHVFLQPFRLRARRRLPSRHLLGRVEVVRQVLGVAVAHFPAGWEPGVILLWWEALLSAVSFFSLGLYFESLNTYSTT